MAAGIWFWIIMVVCLVAGGYGNRTSLGVYAWNYGPVFILLAILGFSVYGSPIK